MLLYLNMVSRSQMPKISFSLDISLIVVNLLIRYSSYFLGYDNLFGGETFRIEFVLDDC